MNPTEKLFNILVKDVESGKLNTQQDVQNKVFKLCGKYGIILTKEQRDTFVQAFCNKYLDQIENLEDILIPEAEELVDEDIDILFEEPESEEEIILKKIEAYKEKLKLNPENKVSIQSMISKLRKKLRDLGYVEEKEQKVSKKTIKKFKEKLEQLELDLALAPMQKRKSVQSMISKIKKQLRDLGDTDYIKQPKEKVVKLTPAEKIGLNEMDFDAYINVSCMNVKDTEPFNKLIIVTLLKYSKQNNIDLQELAIFVSKYMKNKFTDFCLPDNKFILGNDVASLIENQTIKNLAKGIKSIRSLTIGELISLDSLNIDLSNTKLLKKISKCSSIIEVNRLLN